LDEKISGKARIPKLQGGKGNTRGKNLTRGGGETVLFETTTVEKRRVGKKGKKALRGGGGSKERNPWKGGGKKRLACRLKREKAERGKAYGERGNQNT